jgi:hypothetical protein
MSQDDPYQRQHGVPDGWHLPDMRDDVIVDPELIRGRPEKQHKDAMDARATASLRLTMALGACLAVAVLAILLVVLHYAGMITAWSLLAPVVLAFPAVGWAASAERSYRSLPPADQPDRNDLARPDRMIRPRDLDAPCQKIARRARQAIDAILGSAAYKDNLLQQSALATTLNRHEWEVALILRDITKLRARHAGFQPGHPMGQQPGPLTSAVLDPQQRVLAQAERSAEVRVSAIERYAAEVKAVDNARMDWESSMRLSGLNDSFLDLAARTAADEHVIRELRGMTDQARAAAGVYYDSLTRAALAAEALAFPVGPGIAVGPG